MKTIKLIDGNYNKREAADILLSVIGDKIRFHEIKKLSLKERLGIDSEESTTRLKELRTAQKDVIDLIKQLENRDVEVSISASIAITVNELA